AIEGHEKEHEDQPENRVSRKLIQSDTYLNKNGNQFEELIPG
ncbi:MAG: hypothetical protein RL417_1192, partial [Pseudomonadota bacterium]